MVFGIDEARVSIEYVGEAVARAGRSDEILDGRGAGQGIACIDVPHVVARGSVEALVHRIIDPLITFAIDLGFRSQLADELQRVVLRSSVDDEVLDVWVGLCRDAAERACDRAGSVVANRDDGYTWLHRSRQGIGDYSAALSRSSAVR